MLQKNCENEIRELSRDQQEMLDEHIDRLNKVFKGKDNYAGIAVMSEKYAPVVRENKEAYPLNEIQVIIKKNGEPFVRCSWKSDEGTSSFPLQFSAKTSKSGQISGSVFVRGQMESPIVIDSSDEFELDGFYELMVHACDEEMGYLWVGDGKNEGLTRMDYLLSGNACICFGFNGDGWSPYGAVAYGGSALFIDGVGENGKMNSGYGDIKISGKDMTKLLSYLDSDYNPTITIRAAQ